LTRAGEAAAIDLRLASSDADIAACHAVMHQLRPHVAAADFVPRVRRQMAQGYRLLAGSVGGRVVAAAGFRLIEMLAWGKGLYVDDLVTDSAQRSRGYGEALMRWLIEHARQHGCEELHLDSGVQRFDAHRFYLAQRMKISSHHFAIDLRGSRGP
jgi:GNAT superfamily N-acetyltransferase